MFSSLLLSASQAEWGNTALGGNPYVVWDPSYLYDTFNALLPDLGNAFNMGIVVFICLTVVYFAISLVRGLMQ